MAQTPWTAAIRRARAKNHRSGTPSGAVLAFQNTSSDAIGNLAREWIHQHAQRLGRSGAQAHHGSLTWAFAIVDAVTAAHADHTPMQGTLQLSVMASDAQVATSWELDLNADQQERTSPRAPFIEVLAATILGKGGLIARHTVGKGRTTVRGWRLLNGELWPYSGHEMHFVSLVDPATGRWLGPEPGVVYADAFPVPLP